MGTFKQFSKGPLWIESLSSFRINLRFLLALSFLTFSSIFINLQPMAMALATAAEYYVAPTGSSAGNGTKEQPWDLQTPLTNTSKVIRPGDTVWVRGGTYRGSYSSNLSGISGSPITIRNYNQERAIIDSAPLTTPTPDWVGGGIGILGKYTWIWGLEFTSSYPNRSVSEPGPFPTKLGRWYAIGSRTSGNKLINLIVHDMAGGIGFGWEGTDNEIYGNIVYYNGWQGPDDSHGHGIYSQNQTGIQKITDNITFGNFSHGIHLYGSDQAFLNNIDVEGNTAFLNGSISNNDGRDLLYGGAVVSNNPIIKNNNTYRGEFNMGYGAGCTNGTMTDNYLIGSFQLINCNPVSTGNTIWDPTYGKQYGYGNFPSLYPNNVWSRDPLTGTKIMVRPNQYEKGRAHIIIYNWDKLGSVAVDLSSTGLTVGQSFEIKDVQNLFGAAVVTSTYTGTPVSIPMESAVVTAPVGSVPKYPAHTSSEFGIFVVLPISPGPGSTPTALTPTPVPTLTPAPTPTPTPNHAPEPSAKVSFLTIDTTTQGSWKTKYGADGYQIANDGSKMPAYAMMTINAYTWTWVADVMDVKALQKSVSSGRISSTWYIDNGLTIDLKQTDNQIHQIALYMLDWDNANRSQTVEIVNTATNQVLDSRSVNALTAGKYLVYNITGNVKIKVTKTGGGNVIINGMFFGGAGQTTLVPPVVSNILVSGLTYNGATVNWTTDKAGDGQVEFCTAPGHCGKTTTLVSLQTTVHNIPLTNLAANTTYYYWITSKDSSSNKTVSAMQSLQTAAAPASPVPAPAPNPNPTSQGQAAYLTTDTATHGTWKPKYGGDGYQIAGDTNNLPSYASVTYDQRYDWTWSAGTTDARALQKKGTGIDRIAANWYHSDALNIHLKITDNQVHQLAFYFLDWDNGGREQTIEMTDESTKQSLDKRTISSFVDGKYLLYSIKGSVKITLKRNNGYNAVLSGIFFGAGLSNYSAQSQVAFVGTDIKTQGQWKGKFGSAGYMIASESKKLPDDVSITLDRASEWIWNGNPNDGKSLQKGESSGRIASTWYNENYLSIFLDFKDSQTHKVTLYMLDWDNGGRGQTIEVIDPITDTVFDQREIKEFNVTGKYLTYQVKGPVKINVKRTSGYNAVVNGIFID